MAHTEKGVFGEDKSRISLKEHILKYLSYWYIFVLCLLICIGGALFYVYYTPPKYIASTSILVKGGEGNSEAGADLLESTLKVTRQVNLNNEIMLMGATNLMQRTVDSNNFNTSYFIKGRILNSEIYTSAPFRLLIKNPGDSSSFILTLTDYDKAGGKAEYSLGKNSTQVLSFKWNEPFKVGRKELVLEPKREMNKVEGVYSASWKPGDQMAAELLSNLSIKAYDENTSVIDLTLKTGNLEKGKDILDALFEQFYAADIEDRSKLSASTVQFIDDRLLLISQELKGVEGKIENYQGSNQLADIRGQLTQSLDNSSSVTKTIKDLAIQQGVVNMILEYFSKQENSSKLVPSSLGLNDATLASLIAQYNDMQLKREREAPLVAPNSTVMQDLNTQLSNLKGSILESLNSINKNLQLQESGFQQQSNQYRSFLSAVPHNERVLQEIKRQQSITEGLYLYLLQKREEAAISSTSSKVAHYKQIDPASGYGPVEPNGRNLLIYASLLGLFLSFGIIQLKDLLNDKVKVKDDISRKLALPVIGEINHVSAKKRKTIEVLERSLVSEQFRSLRTNLSFLLKKEKVKTIMITSTVSGDGKSFISLNLGAVCAIPGRKTALLEFDIRNPVINDHLYVDNTKGLTDFIAGTIHDPSEIVRIVEEIPSLHIYPCGPVPDNPGDLLLSDRVSLLFDKLKENYEYIIIDAAPVGLVTDPILLGKHSDMVLYVIRQQSTLKKDLDFIAETAERKSLENIHIVLNDVKMSDKAKYKKYYG